MSSKSKPMNYVNKEKQTELYYYSVITVLQLLLVL